MRIFSMFFVFLVLLSITIIKTGQNIYAESNTIEHLSFTPLMSFPESALNPKNELNSMHDLTQITHNEFQKILYELYEKNYILIDIEQLINLDNLQPVIQTLDKLPQNKKPILISFNNVSYKNNHKNSGSIDKIIIDRSNQLASYTARKSIQDRVQYNNDFILILENFISTHPDFSYNNARGIIFLTGENGLLGYNTSSKNVKSKFESKKAHTVLSHLKSLGWEIGSNNYSYKSLNDISDMEFMKEQSLWNKEIKPIIGSTQLFSFPNGEIDKINLLLENNFNLFFSFDNTQPRIVYSDGYATLYSRQVNGNTLRNMSKEFSHLFDCNKVYDHTNRLVPYTQLPL